jgi:ribosomal protein L44E
MEVYTSDLALSKLYFKCVKCHIKRPLNMYTLSRDESGMIPMWHQYLPISYKICKKCLKISRAYLSRVKKGKTLEMASLSAILN